MAGYEFQSSLYRSVDEMCDAIASEYMTNGGSAPRADVVAGFAHGSDEYWADECIENWSLDRRIDDRDDESPAWMPSVTPTATTSSPLSSGCGSSTPPSPCGRTHRQAPGPMD